MFRITKAEKIEMIVLGYLKDRTVKFRTGRIEETGPSRYRVTTEDGEFIVSCDRVGWNVTEPGSPFVGTDRDLLEAGTLFFSERV